MPSDLKEWVFCAFYHKLTRIDKLSGFKGNEYTAFGSAMHSVCEKKLLQEGADERFFIEEFKKNISLLDEDIEINKKLVLDMVGQGKNIIPEIHANSDLLTKLKKFSSELKFIFITSDCTLNELLPNQESRKIFEYNYSITVSKNLNMKCERCWHKNESVGTINKHQSLCSRCCDNVEGKGEARQLG